VEAELAQLVVLVRERENVLREHHDASAAGHHRAEGIFHRIESCYYWTGMRKHIREYIKNCKECNKYKASNQKPAS
jgi:hypothetical protein